MDTIVQGLIIIGLLVEFHNQLLSCKVTEFLFGRHSSFLAHV
jgi:hypothetical protein